MQGAFSDDLAVHQLKRTWLCRRARKNGLDWLERKRRESQSHPQEDIGGPAALDLIRTSTRLRVHALGQATLPLLHTTFFQLRLANLLVASSSGDIES